MPKKKLTTMSKSENKVLMIYLDNSVMVNALQDDEAGKVFKSLFHKYADGETQTVPMSDAARMVFLSISNAIDRQIAKYDERNERRSQAKKQYWENKKREEEPSIEVKQS